MKRRTKIVGILAVAGVAAVSSSSFTNSLTGPPASKVLGYGATTVTGGNISSIAYGYNTDKTQLISITADLDGDTSASTLQVGYTAGVAPDTCAAGNYNSGTSKTTYVCTLTWTTSSITRISYILS
jgi:hypothetical protein